MEEIKKDRITRPDKITFRVCNNIGFIVESRCKLPELKCYVEGGSVLFWASVLDRDEESEIEALQYLSPSMAMKMAKALERCAIEALKNEAND